MTVIDGVRAAADEGRSGLADLRDTFPDLRLRELRVPTPAREALSDLREALPDPGVVIPAVAAGLAEVRDSLPAAPWARRGPSIPQRILIVVVAGLVVMAAAWLISAVIDRRRQATIDRRRQLETDRSRLTPAATDPPAATEEPPLSEEPLGPATDIATERSARVRKRVDQEGVATSEQGAPTGGYGARQPDALSVSES